MKHTHKEEIQVQPAWVPSLWLNLINMMILEFVLLKISTQTK